MKCHRCGTENPERAQFCLNCGVKLGAIEVTAERKFATILFADLKEFTTLCEEKDPEEVREIIKELFIRFDNILEKSQVGYHEYIGDAVLALFGVPIAYGDDAERAITAGLSMQAEIKKFAKQIGVNIEMRIGINSGEMIYGEIPGKTTVTGDAVNTTQRLSVEASASRILISEATAKLVEGKVYTHPLPPLKLKGKKEEVIAYEVIKMANKVYPAFLSQIVGRDKEFSQLKQFFSPETSGLTFTVVIGETGIGKSRLLFELRRYLEKEHPALRVITIRCAPYRTLIYQTLADLIREVIQEEKSTPITTVIEKIEPRIIAYDPLAKHFLGLFFGIKFNNSPLDYLTPESARQTAFAILKNLLEDIAGDKEMVIIFEDCHYADSGTTDFLEFLTQTEINAKLKIMLVGRAEGIVEEVKKGKLKGNWNTIELQPLNEQDSRTMIKNFFGQKEVSEELMQALIQRTGGNPLFIEEFIKDIKEKTIALKDPDTSLPNSLWALLEARIDSFEPIERTLLRTASVIGKVFWKKVLERLITHSSLGSLLSLLEAKGIIYEQQPSRILKTQEFEFNHELLREAAYKTILKKQRKELHKEVFCSLKEHYEKEEIQIGLYLYLAAYHSEYAEEYDEAAKFYEALGDNAKERYAHREALNSYTKAIEIRSQKTEVRSQKSEVGQLINKKAESEMFLCEYDRAIEDYEKIAKSRDRETKILGLLGLANVYDTKGDFDTAIEYSTKAERNSEKYGLMELFAQSLHLIGRSYLGKGIYEQALEYNKKAITCYESLIQNSNLKSQISNLKNGLAKSIKNIGNTHWYKGDYESAIDSYKQSFAICEEIDDKYGVAQSINNIALVHNDREDYLTALKFHNIALKMYEGMGDKSGVAACLNNIGIDYDRIGEKEKALNFYNQSLEIFNSIGKRDEGALILCNIGNVLHYIGKYDEAIEVHEKGLKIHRESGDKRGIAVSLNSIGEIYCDKGDYETALTYQKEAEQIFRIIGAKSVLVYCLNSIARVEIEKGESQKAIDILKEAYALCEEMELKSETCTTLTLMAQTVSNNQKPILDKALHIALECKSKETKSTVLIGYTKFYLQTQEYKLSKEMVLKLITLLKEMKCQNYTFAEALYLAGICYKNIDENKMAQKYLSQALSMAEKLKLKPLISKIRPLLASDF